MEHASENLKTCDPSLLVFKQQFWKVLFEEHGIAKKIPKLVCESSVKKEDGKSSITFFMNDYGKVSLKIEPASCLGDNFFSDAYLIKATFENSSISLSAFTKVLPGNRLLRETVYESRAHHRENNIYQTLFQNLRQIRGNLPIPLDVPNFFYGQVEEMVEGKSDGSETCIILEDLKEEGYGMVDKSKRLDDDHVTLALSSLAHYHALTIVTLRRLFIQTECFNGESHDMRMDDIDRNLHNQHMGYLLEKTIADHDPVETIQPWLEVFIDLVNDVNRPELGSWLSGLREKLPDIMQPDTFKSSHPLACIAHGDFWSNNILFKYSTDKSGTKDGHSKTPIAVKMVDFQIARISHPMSDILYFLYISTQSQLRKGKLEDWLKFYFSVLLDDLEMLQMGLGDYGWQNFVLDYRKRSLKWMLYSGMIMSLVHNNVVVETLNKLHENEIAKEASNGMVAESLEYENQSSKLSTTLSASVKKNKLSCNPYLTEQLLGLFEEVKSINDA